LKNLRLAILKEQGKGIFDPEYKTERRTPPEGKTDRMLLVEQQNGGVDITILIRQGTVREVAKVLGVNYATISLWRRNLGVTDGPLSGHQMHKVSCGPDCHAVSLDRCYAPTCEHPTCGCWHTDNPDVELCDPCRVRQYHGEDCICMS